MPGDVTPQEQPKNFHDRYATDPEFKAKIDESRATTKARQNETALGTALGMVNSRPYTTKLY